MKGIPCRERRFIKILNHVYLLLWFILAVAGTYTRVTQYQPFYFLGAAAPIFWVVWIVGSILLFVGSPDFYVVENGLEVVIFNKKYLIEWKDVLFTRNFHFETYIFVKRLTIFNYLIGLGIFTFLPAFHIGFWRENYFLVITLIEKKARSG